ncbi:hypothetical protein BJS_00728 [Bradyrhizobium japonicum SEMIA 5079]|nr:hypothetical protein BJS_00728 [Bradyrhizobium japonicum SEMIA 5079]
MAEGSDGKTSRRAQHLVSQFDSPHAQPARFRSSKLYNFVAVHCDRAGIGLRGIPGGDRHLSERIALVGPPFR